MKTQTKNLNTRNCNFFQKTFILLAILTFTSFGFKAKAQAWTFAITNNAPSGCDWLIILADNTGGSLDTFTTFGGSGLVTFGCKFPGLTFDNIAMVNKGGNCMGYTFGSGAVFPYTAVIPSCTWPTITCATGIDCQGAAATRNCIASPPVGNFNVVININ